VNKLLFKIEYYVPESHLEETKLALFLSGAGIFGDYDFCAWQTNGTGQFRPSAESKPFLGSLDQLEIVEEYKVELVCEESCLNEAIAALKTAHPYEEPAYSVIRLERI
jgi:hypothetical protein